MKPGVWTLGRKMVALLLVASTVPLALMAYLSFRSSRDRLHDSAVLHLGSLGDAAVHNLDSLNRRYHRTVAAMVTLPEVLAACADPTGAGDAARVSLRTLHRSDPALFGVSIADHTGRIHTSSDPAFEGVLIPDRSYFLHAVRGDGVVSEVLVSRSARVENAVVFALRFGDPAAPCVGIVATRGDDLFDTVRALNASMGRSGYVQLVDDHGIRLAHGLREDLAFHPTGEVPPDERAEMVRERRFGSRTEALLDEVIPVPAMWREARALSPRRDVLRVYTTTTGEHNLMVARRMNTAPWTVFALVPVRVIDEPLGALLRTIAVLGVAMMLTALVAGLTIGRRLLRPVLELTRTSRALAGGDATARAQVVTSDEVGELAHHFNRAADRAATSAADLERTVAERTRELVIANHELQRNRDELLAHRTELIAQKNELAAQRDALAKQSRDIERADRMKSDFLANMSHELRTPLNSVIGFADLLQVAAEPRLLPVERTYLADIVGAGRHLLLIINDILDLAKIEAGHVRLEATAIDPEELAAGAIAMSQGMARPRDLELRLTVTTRRAVHGDPDRLRQVLLNLLSNAIKFSPEGATIDVRIEDVGDLVAFAVIDRGPGIPPEVQATMFRPFVQGERVLVKRHQGTGLGLAISAKLIEMHGGTLTVDSEVGSGSVFRFTVPARNQRAWVPASETTVLLVGAPGSLAGHRARLELAGYHVVDGVAEDDLRAVASAIEARLIVVDIDSLTDRAQADAIVKAAPTWSLQVPVVLLSERSEVLCAKPLDVHTLQALCRRLARRDDGLVRVLVIDDDPRVGELVASALGASYSVETAISGTDGLARARAASHDLYIVDLRLPDLDGFEVLAALEDDPALRKVPRIVLTAAELDDKARERLRQSVHAVAHKGMVTPDELVHVVDRLALGRVTEPAPAAEPAVLLVDDNDMNRALARSILERLAYRVIEARDGDEALAVAEREHPALVLMDLAMPGKDGFQTTRELRAHPVLGRTPIVAVSAMAMRSDQERARAAGVDGYLTKPLDRDALERTVARYVRDRESP